MCSPWALVEAHSNELFLCARPERVGIELEYVCMLLAYPTVPTVRSERGFVCSRSMRTCDA